MIRDIVLAVTFGLSISGAFWSGANTWELHKIKARQQSLPDDVHLSCKQLARKILICKQMESI